MEDEIPELPIDSEAVLFCMAATIFPQFAQSWSGEEMIIFVDSEGASSFAKEFSRLI